MKKDKKIIMSIQNISKRYRLGVLDISSVFKINKTDNSNNDQHISNGYVQALNNISIDIAQGDKIGLIGKNGAGKSTLLKLICRITMADEGYIGYNGKITSLLEIGTGFNIELTGRENIYLYGAMLGMKKKEIDSRIDEIISFSEIEEFIDTPIKRYSSGMYMRLAFSVAVILSSEIIIMDEILSVGDIHFENKCINKMLEISNDENKTIIYVSHNMSTIKELCDRVIVLDEGKIVFDGDVKKGIEVYEKLNKEND